MKQKLSESKRRAFVRRLLSWGRQNRRSFPWRSERDPFKVLLAEMLLQRSRSSTVSKVFEQLLGRWPDPHSLAEAAVEDIQEVIRPLGLTSRAKLIKDMATEVSSKGEVPRSVTEMLRLSGVGRYAASATAATAFQQRLPVVDGTSARVYRRYFGLGAPKDSLVDEELWGLVSEVTPRSAVGEWNWAVLDLAALICLPKVPRCPECPLRGYCSVGRARIQESDAAED